MSLAAERAFRASLKSRAFERVYYLYGEDAFLAARALRDLIDAAVEPAIRDFNLDVRDAASLDAGGLGSLLGTPPMMAARRVIVVRDVGALRKDAREVLDAYVASPAADVVLVLMGAFGEQAKADKALAARATTVEFDALNEERCLKWIAHIATERGARITAGAGALLLEAIGNDLPALASEIDKLATAAGDQEIDEQAVTAVVGVRRGETLADLLDRVAARDAPGALAILPAVLAQPKASPVTTVMALGTQTLALAWGSAVRGRPDYFGLLREGSSAYTGRSWGDATEAWQRATGSWSGADLDAALEALLAADIALKETTTSTAEQLLATAVLSLCADAHA